MKPKDEFKLIESLTGQIPLPSSRVKQGIGDDAAVVAPPRGSMLATVDSLVEKIHFDLAYASFEEVGHKALAVSLSDIAAMGGVPLYALVSLGVREGLPDDWEVALYQGMGRLAEACGVDIVGGNVSRTSQLSVDVTVLGEAIAPVYRSGVKVGDWLAVTGPLGLSALGVDLLQREGRSHAQRKSPLAVKHHLAPVPLLGAGQALAAIGVVGALIDISDGLSSECQHLADASGVGIVLDAVALPIADEVRMIAPSLGLSATELALHGGEDYELLFSFAPGLEEGIRRALASVGSGLFLVGEAVAARGVFWRDAQGKQVPLISRGWNHLSGPAHKQVDSPTDCE